MPTMESGMPIHANSKKPNGVSPEAPSVALMRMFGGVPIIVIVPPTFAATASAMSCGETGSFAAAQIWMTTGMRHATVAVFEDTDESTIVMSISAAINARSSLPDFLTTAMPIFCASPVWNIAAPMMNIPAKRTTVELDSPENTCAGVSTPRRPSAIAAPIAVTASGIISVAKRKAATPRTPNVSIAASMNTSPIHTVRSGLLRVSTSPI